MEEFNAHIHARTPKNATAFDIAHERARQFGKDLRGVDSLDGGSIDGGSIDGGSTFSYHFALCLQGKLEAIEEQYHLTQLHIATYMGY